MVKNTEIFVIILLLVANSRTCVDYIYDIHTFISNMGDSFGNMEANMRIQFNTFHIERLKILKSQFDQLETINNILPRDLCKYQDTEESISFQNIGEELINDVRKNLMYSVRAEFEEMRIEQSNAIFSYIAAMANFLEDCFEPARAYFTGGKACVMGLERNIQIFLETGSSRMIQCLRNSTARNPLQHPGFRSQIDFMTRSYRKQSNDMRRPFILPVLIGFWSSKRQNETAARALLTVTENLKQLILFYSRYIFIGDEVSIPKHTGYCKKYGTSWSRYG